MNYSATLDQHSIDDIPEIDSLPVAARALDAFARNFPFPLNKIEVAPDARSMKIRLGASLLTKNYLSMVRLAIVTCRLPLEVTHDLFQFDGIIFENNLIVTYTGNE